MKTTDTHTQRRRSGPAGQTVNQFLIFLSADGVSLLSVDLALLSRKTGGSLHKHTHKHSTHTLA